jgi:superfamily II DNA/RNA helicase
LSLLARAVEHFSSRTESDPHDFETDASAGRIASELQGDGTTFASLGISPDLVAALDRAGIHEPFPVQTLTIPDALAGRDVSGKAKTGSGKTLAFGLPLIERTTTAQRRRPHSLVLVPTRELANQIAEALAPLAVARGLWLTAIYGGVSMMRQITALRAGVDIVIATPGRLNDLLERNEISVADVKFVVLDEADQMADMGFLPQVERILCNVEGQAQTLLFSATLDGAVGELVRRYQHEPVRHEIVSDEASVETLTQRFIGTTSEEKIAVTAQICAGARRALLFVRTTHGADRLAESLSREGLRAGALHGRLSQSKRDRQLAMFSDGSVPVLVATNVAARGLHVDGIDVVIHYDPPEDGKTYLHRSGRTARAGESGLVVTLALPEQIRDITRLERDAGLDYTIVPMRSGDERLLDLAAWDAPHGLADTRSSAGGYASSPARGGSARGPRQYGGRPTGGSGGRAPSGGGGGRPSAYGNQSRNRQGRPLGRDARG